MWDLRRERFLRQQEVTEGEQLQISLSARVVRALIRSGGHAGQDQGRWR